MQINIKYYAVALFCIGPFGLDTLNINFGVHK